MTNLTQEEKDQGFFVDAVLGKCNIGKTLAERSDAIRKEYEAFSTMHINDGITSKPERSSKL